MPDEKVPAAFRQRELYLRSGYGVLVAVGDPVGVAVLVALGAAPVLVTVGVALGAAVVLVGVALGDPVDAGL